MDKFLLLCDPVDEALIYLRAFFSDIHFADGIPLDWEFDNQVLAVVTDIGGTGPSSIINDIAQLSFEVSSTDQAVASLQARRIHGVLRLWSQKADNVIEVTTNRRPTSYPLVDRPEVHTYMFLITVKFRAEQITL